MKLIKEKDKTKQENEEVKKEKDFIELLMKKIKKEKDTIYKKLIWFGLVSWVLWHINLCKLFNAKSIFM